MLSAKVQGRKNVRCVTYVSDGRFLWSAREVGLTSLELSKDPIRSSYLFYWTKGVCWQNVNVRSSVAAILAIETGSHTFHS